MSKINKKEWYKPKELSKVSKSFEYSLVLPKGNRIYNLSLAMYMWMLGQRDGYLDEEGLSMVAEGFGLTKEELDESIEQIRRVFVSLKTEGVKEGLVQLESFKFLDAVIYDEDGNIKKVLVYQRAYTKYEDDQLRGLTETGEEKC